MSHHPPRKLHVPQWMGSVHGATYGSSALQLGTLEYKKSLFARMIWWMFDRTIPPGLFNHWVGHSPPANHPRERNSTFQQKTIQMERCAINSEAWCQCGLSTFAFEYALALSVRPCRCNTQRRCKSIHVNGATPDRTMLYCVARITAVTLHLLLAYPSYLFGCKTGTNTITLLELKR